MLPLMSPALGRAKGSSLTSLQHPPLPSAELGACHQATAMALRIRTAVGLSQRSQGGGAGRRPVTGDMSGERPAGGLIFEPSSQDSLLAMLGPTHR